MDKVININEYREKEVMRGSFGSITFEPTDSYEGTNIHYIYYEDFDEVEEDVRNNER